MPLLLPFPLALILAGSLVGSPADGVPKKYEGAIEEIDAFVAREVAAKKVPSLAIVIIDDQTTVWSKGYGFADANRAIPATADTVYRVGSVARLFTDLAVMQLVEQEKIDLDAPATTSLPGFAPKGTGAQAITLRQMMTSRSGLPRQPPVGHFFDPTSPSLEATVASLNEADLIYPPGTHVKSSDAALAAVGLAVEKVTGEPYADAIARRVFAPLGMTQSSLRPSSRLTKDLAFATMATYHGREFPAPGFELGISPAGSMVSTANDLAKFVKVLFKKGEGPAGRFLERRSLDEVSRRQFASLGEDLRSGRGVVAARLPVRRMLGHAGSGYGTATEIAILPGLPLGVVVIASRDGANGLTQRMSREALGQILAARDEKPLPFIETTRPLEPGLAKSWAGRYGKTQEDAFDLLESAGRLWFEPTRGGLRVELRLSGRDFVGDDLLDYGPRLVNLKDGIRVETTLHSNLKASSKPSDCPAEFQGLIGEYGWDHNTLYVYEKDGFLHSLIEWFYLAPLRKIDADTYAFGLMGLYDGEKLVFKRDPAGKAIEVNLSGVVFKRRAIDGEDGRTFRIKPTRPVEDIRREIEGLKPPVEGPKKPADLVDLVDLVPGVKLDLRYATTNNFLSTPLYTSARPLMQRPAAEALARVQAALRPLGYGLLIHDAYRPWRVTKLFWEATPEVNHVFVADPSKGSRHNRGAAVDLTLCDLETGRPIAMVGGYDEFSDRSYPNYPGGTSRQREARDLLRTRMEAEGFTVNEAEWWHFDFKGWQDDPILDIPFEAMPRPLKERTSREASTG